ncbi:MAG: bifunctional methylenetetrahydrofolate dehydrogenase/methenyltetrahydrofolate cyclohydrolase FolD [Sutterellaceae bacterium]|nr:bifunctional methylenetetrahydrofolate dehydrogenase/methenyltetrahydrofolate cyclohydrolase FolD [Sutterellaceae bacterium]MDD7441512.1 bifunctional methylenetetrahydrofolate dehydrogenase/methenyltetrahydrofolate cyclohydrolase FolD [Sutterellaceae bacterium]MDY2867350.1 bifunctional methylenetetrahydrofolate dehydrogenase/methenyltetrahydrofolate cyclohydrolase FolD [Mesosutterella sp.]
MTARLIDGKALAARIRAEMKAKASELLARTGRAPGLAVILVGENPASQVYVRNKIRACHEVGIRSIEKYFPATTSEAELLDLIKSLNENPGVDGILVQLPLPGHISNIKVIDAISPEKDVDGFHVESAGRLLVGREGFRPCTPFGICAMLDSIGFDCTGKRAVVIGRSNIVGKPMSIMLLERNATVTIAHSRTKDLPALCREADLLVAAVGRAKMVDASYVKPGAVVIDVGMDRDENGKLCGDVDTASVMEKASWVTPVPGGVGPMTIAMLIQNTVGAALRREGKPLN